VGRYLLHAGYTIIPVNPTVHEVFDIPAVPDLDSINIPVDIVDIFRRAEVVPDVIEAAIRIRAGAVWMQFGSYHAGASQRASAAQLAVVPDRCIMIEHQRLIR
jgi:predicted CoA-binding protein